MKANLANALVIIACLYFMVGNFSIWILFILLFVLADWGIKWSTKEDKELRRLIRMETEARIKNFAANTAYVTAQAAGTMRLLKKDQEGR